MWPCAMTRMNALDAVSQDPCVGLRGEELESVRFVFNISIYFL